MVNKLLLVVFSSGMLSPVYAVISFEDYGDIGQFAIPAIAAGISWYK